MSEVLGVAAAVLSSAIGGTAVGATRYLADGIGPVTLGALRFGLGSALLVPIVLLAGRRWPDRAEWPAIAGLGLLFFAAFPVLFNAALAHTTAARGALALSTLPLLTMLVAAILRIESLTLRKTAGVAIAVGGVALALLSGLAEAGPAMWRGDLLMIAAAFCMALYTVWSRPLVARLGAVPFTACAMAVGAAVLLTAAVALDGLGDLAGLAVGAWVAVAFLGVFGGAAAFLLWATALAHTTPTRVAVSVTVNPLAAAVLGVGLLGEPVGWNFVAGFAAVVLGIWLAAGGETRTPPDPA